MQDYSPHAVFLDSFRVERNGCWIWTRKLFPSGYGDLRLTPGRSRKSIAAHRYSFLLHRGPYDQRLDLDHLCRNRACVNPDHLQPVTRRENVRRSPIHNGSKTHCPRSHPYDEANTYWTPDGRRKCRECTRINQRALKAKKRALGLTR